MAELMKTIDSATDRFRRRLLAVWSEACCENGGHGIDFVDGEEFASWSGETKNLLLGLGLMFCHTKEDYVFDGDCHEMNCCDADEGSV